MNYALNSIPSHVFADIVAMTGPSSGLARACKATRDHHQASLGVLGIQLAREIQKQPILWNQDATLWNRNVYWLSGGTIEKATFPLVGRTDFSPADGVQIAKIALATTRYVWDEISCLDESFNGLTPKECCLNPAYFLKILAYVSQRNTILGDCVSYFPGKVIKMDVELGLKRHVITAREIRPMTKQISSSYLKQIGDHHFQRGMRLRNPKKSDSDFQTAIQYYTISAAQGNPEALCFVGVSYLEGLGVQRDAVKAARFFQFSADKGLATAQYNLGLLYIGGIGVSKDLLKAEGLLQKAADQGYEEAYEALAALREEIKS